MHPQRHCPPVGHYNNALVSQLCGPLRLRHLSLTQGSKFHRPEEYRKEKRLNYY